MKSCVIATILLAAVALGATPIGTSFTWQGTLTAGDADTVNGQHRAYYRAWSSLTGVPADLADGDDDTLAELACSSGDTVTWNGTAWVCDPDDHVSYQRTVVVGPAGDPIANGNALRAALAALPTPGSAQQGWLVQVEAGVYDLNGRSLWMKPWIDIEGAGQEATLITSSACSSDYGATVRVAAHVELRDLAVNNTCATAPSAWSRAISGTAEGVRITRVTAAAVGDAEYCAGLSLSGAGHVIDHVSAWGGGAAAVWGIAIEINSANALIIDSQGPGTNVGLRLAGDGSQVRRGTYIATGAVVAGFVEVGILVADSDVRVSDVTVEGPAVALDISSDDDDVVTLSRINASGTVETYTDAGASMTLLIEHSRIRSAIATIADVGNHNVVIGVAATLLDGDPVSVPAGSTIACAGVWDEN